MTRTEAVARLNEGTGLRAVGHSLTDIYIRRLQEAQRDLEKGKTLPRFLLQEDQPLVLTAGLHSVALPVGFLREDDDNPPHFTPTGQSKPQFLERKYYVDAVIAQMRDTVARAPSVFVVRKATLDVVTPVDVNYTFTWNYYKAAALLTTDTENEWLANAPEWLIGEAGWRIAKSLRDKDAQDEFDTMRTQGRAAAFGEDLAAELASGPLFLGEDN